jgi:CheY-like chemotaxis protein
MVESVSGATILVVEDDEDIRRLTVLGLKQRGFDTVEAVDGTAALSMSKPSPSTSCCSMGTFPSSMGSSC